MKQTKARLKRIQSHLGVPVDGTLGPVTLTAIENAVGMKLALVGAVSIAPPTNDFSLTVTIRGLHKLSNHEIGSDSLYKRRFKSPVWPGGRSGVTIGIGYDLGCQSATKIRKDWGGMVSDADLKKLLSVKGVRGKAAKRAARSIRSVVIPLSVAKEVFYTSTLPRYARDTLRAFPKLDQLHPDAQVALLSLVYNRGSSLRGGRRREMRAIRSLVAEKDYSGIAREIKAMKRLWRGKNLPGLLKRRDDEARLVAKSNRPYSEAELVRV